MDHEQSINIKAADRYLLDEFTPEERDAFERHFFECEVCAEEVRLGFEFKETAAAVLREDPWRVRKPQPAQPKWWFAWLRMPSLAPAAACLLLTVMAGYQGTVQIPSLRARVQELNQPRAFQSTFVLAPSSRAAAPAVSLSGGPFVPLTLSIGAVHPAARYECQLRSGSGKVISRIPIARLESDANLTLMIPSAGVTAGSYDAVLVAFSGPEPVEMDHYRFVVRP